MPARFLAHPVLRLRSRSANLRYSKVKFYKGKVVLAAILYDLDGTIADTDPVHFIAWQDCLSEFGISINETIYKQRMSGRTNPPIIAEFLPQLTPPESEALADRKEARFRELATQLQPMAGLLELIDWAKQHSLKQAVVTNAPRENAHFMLQVLKLDQVFDRLILADDLGIGKPDPAPYNYALKEFGLEAHQALAFEDSPSGVRSAVAAGIPTIGITSTQMPETLNGLGVKFAIADFTTPELWALLK
ncbi:HAD-IA family hydrolase [Leptolyngbya sp. FACHB-17]|uniref:HAD family hydrolase n=1 Tax=unclassified Leptolyngbya TaxID=2650499 RepID=UPI0018EFF8D5|nr:HAD-IA family hydrolase [Leptolyngbya sp. FACHB-17]